MRKIEFKIKIIRGVIENRLFVFFNLFFNIKNENKNNVYKLEFL